MSATIDSIVASHASEGPPLQRTSEVLRNILAQNPGVRTFSVERILASIGTDRLEASLLMFSIPAIVPIPAPVGIAAMSTGALACQLMAGPKQVKIPRFILKRSVSRKALAVAIHAVLPVLEAAEQVVRPRWSWVSHALTRRAIGLFVFLLALGIAYPLFGFSALHATSIFVMALGMAERDGLAVLIGVVVGLLSLAFLAASGTSARALRSKAGKWLRKISRKLGLAAFARSLDRHGYHRLGRLLGLHWSEVLLLWDPEKQEAARAAGGAAPRGLAGAQKRVELPLPSTTPSVRSSRAA